MWIGDQLSTMEQLCINSFLQNGHEFHLYIYDDVQNIPQGAIIKDANKILSSDKIFLDDCNGVASFADWFRYKLLYEHGGWWVDMDAVCLKYFDVKDDYCFATEGVDCITNGFIKSPAKSEYLEDMLNYIEQNLNRTVIRGEFGPRLLGCILSQYESQDYIQSSDLFCPIYWENVNQLIDPSTVVFSHKTLAVHLWNEMWRREGINKDAVYHHDSIYETLKRKYLYHND